MAHVAAATGDSGFFRQLKGDNIEKKKPKRLSSILTIFDKSADGSQDRMDPSCVHEFNAYGYAPIHAAAFHDHPHIIAMLTDDFGVSPNQPTRSPKWTLPLHLAILSNNVRCVRTLLKRGANPWLRDGEGWDGWELARRSGRRRVMFMLRAHWRKQQKECRVQLEAGVCTVKYSSITSTNPALILQCSDCSLYESATRTTESDSYLVVKNNVEYYHAHLKVPYGPWDVESGIQYVEEDIPSESDLDIPINK